MSLPPSPVSSDNGGCNARFVPAVSTKCRKFAKVPPQVVADSTPPAEKDSLLAAVSHDIEYYEDEELDRFRGRNSDQYSDAEIEEFNEILTTLRSEEVAGWIRSLQLREIALPDELKDDVILLVGEHRTDLPH